VAPVVPRLDSAAAEAARGWALTGPALDAVLEEIGQRSGLQPEEHASTSDDHTYSLGGSHLIFTGCLASRGGGRETHAVVLPRWPAALLAGRDHLVPASRYYRDRDALLLCCALAWHLDQPLAIHGHTGVGKTELVRHLAALLGAPLYRMNLHGLSTTDDVVGKLLPSADGGIYFQDGLVTAAVREGGILLLEEMNATGQEVWFALHGLLDGSRALVLVEKDNELLPQHPWCGLYSTFNPAEHPGLYPGTKSLSAAYLRRWASVRMDFAPLEVEREILLRRFPSLDEPGRRADLDNMLQVAHAAREILRTRVQAFDFVLSTGVLETWAAFAAHLAPLVAARLAFYDLLEERTKTIFREQIFPYVTDWDIDTLHGGGEAERPGRRS
jgi:MoxR-like ATPase